MKHELKFSVGDKVLVPGEITSIRINTIGQIWYEIGTGAFKSNTINLEAQAFKLDDGGVEFRNHG